MKEYSPYYLIKFSLVLILALVGGGLLLLFLLGDCSEKKKAVFFMSYVVIVTIFAISYINIVRSRTMKQKHMTAAEVGNYFTRNTFFAVVFLLLPIFATIRGCMFWQEQKASQTEKITQMESPEPVKPAPGR